MARHSWLPLLPAVLLAALIGFAGQAKLTPALSPAVHAELAGKAPQWSSVLPTHPDPSLLLLGIGAAEVLSGCLLLLPYTRRWGALLVLVLMLGAAATHWRLSEPFTIPAVLASVSAVVWLLSGKGARRGAKGKKQR